MAKAASFVVAAASISALASKPSFKDFLAKWLGYNAPGGVWRIVAILLAFVNLKNLPLVWHLRFFRAFFYHLYLQPTAIPPHALFQPLITSSRTSILETDYNMHKSNSTYFSDMDISRTNLFTALIRNAIRKNSRLGGNQKGSIVEGVGATEGTGSVRGKHMIALGGIACNFKKEILPYQKYEMWTRLLCWDRKWFYLLTHLVKPGVGEPKEWSLQPWRKCKTENEAKDVDKEKLKDAVFATAIAKYVVKKGRITVAPERVLFDADMVPMKPEGWTYSPEETMNGDANGSAANDDAEHIMPKNSSKDSEWNWNVIEKERLRGLQFAEHFAGLDGLHDVFDGGKEGVLGEYADLLF